MNLQTKFVVRKLTPNMNRENRLEHHRTRSILVDVTNQTNLTNQTILQSNQCNQSIDLPKQYHRRNAIIPYNGIVIKGQSNIQIPLAHKPVINNVLTDAQFKYSDTYNYHCIKLQQECRVLIIQLDRSYDYIDRHQVTKEQIQDTLNAMVLQFRYYKYASYQTIFLAIELFSRYMYTCTNKHNNDLLLIGGICIYLSSKMVDIYSLYIEDVYIDFIQERVTIHEFLKLEQEVVIGLQFNLIIDTPLETYNTMMVQLIKAQPTLELKEIINNLYDRGIIYMLIQCIYYDLKDINNIIKSIVSIMQLLDDVKLGVRMKSVLLQQVDQLYLNINSIEQYKSLLYTYIQESDRKCYLFTNTTMKY